MPHGTRRLVHLALIALVLGLASCSTAPNKRELQYLNSDGFGNRYTGNAEDQNYVTLGDTLSIADSYHPELGGAYTVDIDGTIVLPEVGAVYVAGLTRTELEAFLMQKYSPYFAKLDIKVRLQTRGKVYFVFGEVGQEGSKPFPGDLTIFEAVTSARPNPQTANLGRVRLIRADPRDPLVITCNLSEIVETGDSTFNILVSERDIIYVPPTMMAQLGYFLSDLLFPVQKVMQSLFSFGRGGFGFNNRRGGLGLQGGFNNTFF
ncbi:MAG: polysaccharide biosynthesis/export family protein [Planctomycetes bacterium]|nr:polysaccharide biosynthesis/export family protein [Planctomycetota bacterium]